MIILTVCQPGQSDRRIEVDADSALLGRHEKCDVMLTEGFISNHHLRIMRGIVVIDQKSRNGTYLDGQRLDAPALIHEGDVLTLGKEKMTLKVEYSASDGVGTPRLMKDTDVEAEEAPLASQRPSPSGETWDQKSKKSAELRVQLASLRDQQNAPRADEPSRAQKEAERAVLLGKHVEALRQKDHEIAKLKARIAELGG